MGPRKASLLARWYYYAAQRGWISSDQRSLLKRLLILTHIFRSGLWTVLRQLSPTPFKALWTLLNGRDRYQIQLPHHPPQVLSLSPLNFLNLLRLVQRGYIPIAVNPEAQTLTFEIAPGVSIVTRTAQSADLVTLKELLLEEEYQGSFPDYKIIDIGAYTGDTALFFCSRGAQSVFAVEPAPDNFTLAQQNIQNSPYKDRIHLLPVAVAATDGQMEFYLNAANPHCHALIQGAISPNRTLTKIQVPVWSFEKIVAQTGWDEIDLVKIDCEGAEYAIFSETPAPILQKVKRWVIEYHHSPQPIEARLQSLGYQVTRFKDLSLIGILHAERLNAA